MRIAIDLQGAQGASRNRGIGRYSLAFARALTRMRGEHEVLLALNGALADTIEPLRAAFTGLLPEENVRVWASPTPTARTDPANRGRREQAGLIREAFLASLDPDWVVACSLFEGFENNAIVGVRALNTLPTAAVFYDLIPWIYPGTYLKNPALKGWYAEQLDHLRRANLLLAISESSGKEAVDYLGFDAQSVVNISTAADEYFSPRSVSEAERNRLTRRYGISRPFVMYTGADDPRKNIDGLIRAWARLPISLRQNNHLLIASSSRLDLDHFLQLAENEGLAKNDLVFTGFVSDDDLLLLYNACTLFVFPSWHEGFGLPALEAMRCGRPVIAANRSSLPELLGRTDALFDPFDIDDVAHCMARALHDEAFRDRLAAHGLVRSCLFSWDDTAKRAWAALETRATPKTISIAPSAGSRPRLAYLSPLPPEKSEIADYSAELLHDLTRWYRIDVVVRDPKALRDDYVRATCGVCDIATFRQNARGYDRVLYPFGNSESHEHLFSLIEDIPGVVVLHDFFLSGIQAGSETHGWRPHAWRLALLESHGYAAVREKSTGQDSSAVVMRYPANLPVLQNALGVIVHNAFNCRLADTWYGSGAAAEWKIIPLPRIPEIDLDRSAARARLGLAKDAIIVCSFGILGNIKLNHRLLEAWYASALAQQENAHLVFVGQAAEEYGEKMHAAIQRNPAASRIEVTGWVDTANYRDWLAAADVAVQLRTLSRGETSGTVLDCMNFGLATIVNAHGAMAELDEDTVRMLPDGFTQEELIAAMEALARDAEYRCALGERAKAVIRERHNPRRCAEQYFEAIEQYYTRAAQRELGLTRALAHCREPLTPDLARLMARNHPPAPRLRQLFVDVSALVLTDLKTGIERVVRAVLSAWMTTPPAGYRVEPVYATAHVPGYRYARRFTCGFLGMPDDWAADEPVDAWPGDLFLGLDLQAIITRAQMNVLKEWHTRGVKIYFVTYDLLPVLKSEFFPQETISAFQFQCWLDTISRFDGLVAISRTVADEMHDWLQVFGPKRARPLAIQWFHLGADIEDSAPTRGIPNEATGVLAQLRVRPTFLMVGTIEPRKGHGQTLAAFEQLWDEGLDLNLVLAGKQGWMVEALTERLRAHPESGHRLHWLPGISDEYLDQVYGASTCLIMASEGEGFGLPLIEAARHGRPIIARDLPVFREVADEHAYYFSDDREPEAIAETVRTWLRLHARDAHPASAGIPWQTWKESADQLLERILGGQPPYRQWLPDGVYRYWGGDLRLDTEVGERRGSSMYTTGREGLLCHGPRLSLPSGRYSVAIQGRIHTLTGDEWLKIAWNAGETAIFDWSFAGLSSGPWHCQTVMDLERDVHDLEIRFRVENGSDLGIDRIEIAPVAEGEEIPGYFASEAAPQTNQT